MYTDQQQLYTRMYGCRTLIGNSDSFPEDGLDLAMVTKVTKLYTHICMDIFMYVCVEH